MIEWSAVRNSARSLLPKLAAVAGWKHHTLSFVEQGGQPKPKDRGAEQGDVYGPLKCSLALVTEAAETRLRIAEHQAAGTFRWIGTHDPADAERLPDGQRSRMHRIRNFQLGGLEKLIGADDPRHALQDKGGLAYVRYRDIGDIMCHPMLVLPYLQAL